MNDEVPVAYAGLSSICFRLLRDLLLQQGVGIPAVLFVVLGVGHVGRLHVQALGHDQLNILGEQLGVVDLGRAGIVDGQELDLDAVDRIGQQVPHRVEVRVALVESPGDGVSRRVETGVPEKAQEWMNCKIYKEKCAKCLTGNEANHWMSKIVSMTRDEVRVFRKQVADW